MILGRLMLARMGQTVWLTTLMAILVAPLAAGPWYEGTALESAAVANVSAAPANGRILIVSRQFDPTRESGPPLVAARTEICGVTGQSRDSHRGADPGASHLGHGEGCHRGVRGPRSRM